MDMGYSHKSWACPFCGGKPQIKYNYVAQKKSNGLFNADRRKIFLHG